MAEKQSFAELLEESLQSLDFRRGSLIKATIVDISPERITVNAGLKSDAVIPAEEFKGDDIKVGDEVELVVENVENGFGETRLSREKAKRARVWAELERLHEGNHIVMGTICERVKGGFTVDLDTIRAFLPGSLVDVKPVRDPGYLEGKELEFRIIKMDKKRNNVVVSRRAVMEAESTAERSARLEELQEGQEVIGVVKNITDYGAFVDLGGVDGLLHITDMSWKRIRHPGEMLKVGDEARVKILKFDREKNRVSLGLKQMGEDPWHNIAARYPLNERVKGAITNITDYGCFVELEEGVEGLVHMSEMDWTNKNIHPSKVVQIGEQVEVLVLEIDQDRRRISLGLKHCRMNPWEAFSVSHVKGEKVKGNVRSITDFGLFIGLEGGIDGLIHLSDISWTEAGETAVRAFKKGDEVEAVILAMDPERERISLGIKQMSGDPVTHFMDASSGAKVTGKVVSVEARVANIELDHEVVGQLRSDEYTEAVEDLSSVLKVDDEIEVFVLGMDRKSRIINLSCKPQEEKSQPKPRASRSSGLNAGASTKTTLGDLLKEQMKTNEKDS